MAIPNQAPGAGPRGSGSSTRRRTRSASAGHLDAVEHQPAGRRAAHPQRLEPGPALDPVGGRGRPATTRPRPGPCPSMRAVTKAWVRFGSQVVQVFSPVSRHDAVGLGHGGRARDRAARRRSAALLGRGVVDAARRGRRSRAYTRSRSAVRHAADVDQRPDDVDLHREPERRRAIDRAERHQDLGRLRHPGPEPARRGRHDQSVKPGRDDRLGGPRLEGVAEVERAPAARAASASACVDRRSSVVTFRVRTHRPDRRPARESSISAASRRSRVAACLALVTQCVTVLRYDGDRRCQSAQAAASARKRAVSSSVETARRPLVGVDRRSFASVRASNAARPAGRIRPSSVSSATFATLIALQLLPLRRGVKRWT